MELVIGKVQPVFFIPYDDASVSDIMWGTHAASDEQPLPSETPRHSQFSLRVFIAFFYLSPAFSLFGGPRGMTVLITPRRFGADI